MNKLVLFLLLFPFSLLSQEVKLELNIDTNKTIHAFDTDLLPALFFAKNRQALRDLMPKNSVAVIFSNPIRNRSNDVDYEYHQDPNFYYLTGLQEPHSVLILYKEDQEFKEDFITNEILFLQKKQKREELWTGKRTGIIDATKILKFKTALDNQRFLSFENEYERFDKVFSFEGTNDIKNTSKKSDLYGLIQFFERTTQGLKNTDKSELSHLMAKLRQVKTDEEIALMRKAITITCDAQIELIKALNPQMKEYQAEAIVEYIFKKNGAEYPGFPSILGGGKNSCIIHYAKNRKQLKGQDMLVSDIGAEYHGYTADVTRTIPVDGHFSEEEKIIYNIVLKAQQAGIDSCKVGNKFWTPHRTATKIIANELVNLGILKKRHHVQRYFMHGTSHYLGLDVHDPGLHGTLQPGNVITVEPGIYIPEGSECDPKWWDIGIRIEDDILITLDGPENLSKKVPRSIEAIEALMKEKGNFEE
jgi:Xaa-Pro aminopeptidase